MLNGDTRSLDYSPSPKNALSVRAILPKPPRLLRGGCLKVAGSPMRGGSKVRVSGLPLSGTYVRMLGVQGLASGIQALRVPFELLSDILSHTGGP